MPVFISDFTIKMSQRIRCIDTTVQPNQQSLERTFQRYFKSVKWQNAIMFAVLKTHDKIPEIRTRSLSSMEREKEKEESNSNHLSDNDLLIECSRLSQLIAQYSKNQKDQPCLQSMLEYIIHNKMIVRKRKGGRRSAICEESEIDRDIIQFILKKYRLEKTLLQYSLE